MAYRPIAAIATLVMVVGGISPLATAIAETTLPSPLRWQAPVFLAQAQRQRRNPQANWLKELNLSKEQLQKIQAIRQQYQTRLNQQRQAVQQAGTELKQLIASNASTEQIRQKFDQVQTLRQNLAKTRIESMLAIREVLTPEQRQKMGNFLGTKGKSLKERFQAEQEP